MDHILRNIVAIFFSPTSILTSLLFLGVILLWWKRNSNTGPIFVTLSTLGLVVAGTDPLPEFLLAQTETKYPPFEKTVTPIKHVVVLAGGYIPSDHQPLTSQLGHQTLMRLVEGVTILYKTPDSKLVITGKGVAKERSEAAAMKELAQSLGVPEERIIIEEKSRNTREHSMNLFPIVGDHPFILVTSALHMPRALHAFRKFGLNPVPASTHHLLSGNYKGIGLSKAFITSDNLKAIDEWVFEFWARRKYELTGPKGPINY